MTAWSIVGALALVFVLAAIAGTLTRIARAIERQNERERPTAYTIGIDDGSVADEPVDVPKRPRHLRD